MLTKSFRLNVEKSKFEFRSFTEKVNDEIAESRLLDISDMDEANFLVCKFETRIENLGKIYSDILGIYSGESEEFKEYKDERDELLLRLKEIKMK